MIDTGGKCVKQDNDERRSAGADYSVLITEMLEQIQDDQFLRRIYVIVSDYVKEMGCRTK